MSAVYSALVLGSTGLVGRELVSLLQEDARYHTISCILRRPDENLKHPKLHQHVIDFEKLNEVAELFRVDHVYVCLGTTMKQAGSKAAFKRVDFDYVYHAARLSRDTHCRSFVWLSSVGANAGSRSFYLRTKGELEQAIFAMPHFAANAVRPSLLIGKRPQTRIAENFAVLLGQWLAPLLVGSVAKYRPVSAQHVARQMIRRQVFDDS